jgi:hypothetical protein
MAKHAELSLGDNIFGLFFFQFKLLHILCTMCMK